MQSCPISARNPSYVETVTFELPTERMDFYFEHRGRSHLWDRTGEELTLDYKAHSSKSVLDRPSSVTDQVGLQRSTVSAIPSGKNCC